MSRRRVELGDGTLVMDEFFGGFIGYFDEEFVVFMFMYTWDLFVIVDLELGGVGIIFSTLSFISVSLV